MGWQDRDYARGGAFRYGVSPIRRSGYLIQGSIVTTLIVVNVAIFLLGIISEPIHNLLFGINTPLPGGQVAVHPGIAEMRTELVRHGQIWRLVTAQYLHAGFAHIFFNMFVLYFLGRPLERVWSARKFFVIYTIAGVVGNIVYTTVGINPWVAAVGASGSIYGMIGAVAVLFPTATVYVYFLFPIKIRTLAIILGAIAFLSVQTHGANYGGEACHLGGLVFGAWWAARGDAWWAGTRWGLPGRRRRSRSKTVPFEQRQEQRKEDTEAIDRILKKVYDQGIHSLTEQEKTILREASDREREREAGMGRVDRL